MASNSKKTSAIRNRKKRPNKANLKANQKRLQKNIEIMRELSTKDNA